MKPIALFVAICILASCSPQKRLARIYANHPELAPQNSDSIRSWITYECDSFPINIAGDFLSFDTSGVLPITTNYKHSQHVGRMTQTLIIKDGKITQECHEDSLRAYVKYLEATKHEKDSRRTLVPTPYKTWWTVLYQWGFWIMFGIIALTIVLKMQKII